MLRTFADRHPFADDGGGVYARRGRGSRMQQGNQPRDPFARIANENDGPAAAREAFAHKQAPGFGIRGCSNGFRVSHERNLVRPGRFEGAHAPDLVFAVAFEARLEKSGDVAYSHEKPRSSDLR